MYLFAITDYDFDMDIIEAD